MEGLDRPGVRRLTARELAALQLLAHGYSVGQVAALRGESTAGVFADLHRVADALGVDTLAAAIAAGRRRGLIS